VRDPPRLRLVACFLSVALEHTIFDGSGRKRQKSFSGSSAQLPRYEFGAWFLGATIALEGGANAQRCSQPDGYEHEGSVVSLNALRSRLRRVEVSPTEQPDVTRLLCSSLAICG
jgi:hypothetical protein